MLPDNNYLVRKTGTKTTQVHHRMRLRQFTPRKPLPDIPITPQEWKHDPEVSLKYDDLYARAWEFEYEKTNFDAGNDNVTPPNSPEIAVPSDSPNQETWNTPGLARVCYREFFPRREELCDVTDTYPYMKPDGKQTRSKRATLRLSPAVRNTIYVITRSIIAMTMTNIDVNSCAALMCFRERKGRPSRKFKNALRYQNVAKQKVIIFCSGYSFATNPLATQSNLLQ